MNLAEREFRVRSMTHVFPRSFYYALTEAEWEACSTMSGVVICPEVRMRRDSFSKTCIG